MTKKDYWIGLYTGIVGIILLALYDYVKEKPILSTLFSIIKWIWITFFEFEFKVWQIAIIILVLLSFKKILQATKKQVKQTVSDNIPKWLNYTQDTIDGITWKWKWNKRYATGNWYIADLFPLCECKTPMALYNGSSLATCPRCDKHIMDFKSPEKVEAIIRDNVDRAVYLDK
jgi:hypothetical protein